MARSARLVVPHYPHHVTQRGVRGQQTFFATSDYRMYLDLVAKEKEDAQIRIWAYCLMPNHVHLVVVPDAKDSLCRFFRKVHAEYARRVNKQHGWQGHLWQERFHSFVMQEEHLLAALRYVELNPVRAGLCRSPFEWKWSSANAHRHEVGDGVVDTSALRLMIDDWPRFLGVGESDNQINKFRVHTSNGRPLGSARFIKNLEARTGRVLRRKKPGPKKIK